MDEEDETLRSTAERELREELLLPTRFRSRAFDCSTPRSPSRSRDEVTHNFVALESENRFLRELMRDVSDVNEKLKRRVRFVSAFRCVVENESRGKSTSHSYYRRSGGTLTISRFCTNRNLPRLGESFSTESSEVLITKRDAMFQTMATLMEINQYDSETV